MKHCNDCYYMETNYQVPGYYCHCHHEQLGDNSLLKKACNDFKPIIFMEVDVSGTGWESEIKNLNTNELYGVAGTVRLLNKFYYDKQQLKQDKKVMFEILDAFIRGVEDEKGIDPDNEKFQYAMNQTLNYLLRLKEDFKNPNQYLKLKNALKK